MSKEVITDGGQDAVVREDTAKAFRWSRFVGIVLAGFILILIVAVLFFSGALVTVKPNMNSSNSANQSTRPGP